MIRPATTEDAVHVVEIYNHYVLPSTITFNDSDNEPDEDLYHAPVGKLWQKFLNDTKLRICMNTLQLMGACNGELSSFLYYEIHVDAKTVHCYQVSEAEAERIMEGERGREERMAELLTGGSTSSRNSLPGEPG